MPRHPEKHYKWSHPSEWLLDHITALRPSELVQLTQQIAGLLDGDQIQDLFQCEMDLDGYFTPQRSPRAVRRPPPKEEEA